MPPAYRPGLVPRVALTPRMGSRGRSQLMNDLMGECPSLLDDLVFYPMWQGSQCMDMITGALLTNSANPVLLISDIFGRPAGLYVGANGNYLYGPSTGYLRTGSISFAAWFKRHTGGANTRILATGAGSNTQHGWSILGSDTSIKVNIGNGVSRLESSAIPISLNTSYLVCVVINRNSDKLEISLNGTQYYTDISSIHNDNIAVHYGVCIGSSSGVSSWDGAIGETPIWQRILSYREQFEFYNNGLGLRYPFRR